VGRARVAPELRTELEQHIELRARDNMRAGMEPHEAWADARRRFGDLERIAARCAGPRGRLGLLVLPGVLTALLALVLVDIHVLTWVAASGISEKTHLVWLAALSMLTLALSVMACCFTFTMARRAR
jgi:hypothetical protein